MTGEQQPLTWRRIFVFWAPLSATWLMMAAEGPFLSALIARMDDPVHNLAAYGVTLSLALLMEGPIVMLMSASTALAVDAHSWAKMKRYAAVLNGLITVALAVVLIPPVFDLLAFTLIGVPKNVGRLAYTGLVIMLPWGAAIGYRRLHNGLMIRFGKTRLVAYGTAIRLSSMALFGTAAYLSGLLPGAWVGAVGLCGGATVESICTRLMAGPLIREISLVEPDPATAEPLTFHYINQFYVPLALTVVMNLGTYSIVTFFVGQSRMALESLAVLPIINALLFIFNSFGLSFQEVGIALMDKGATTYRPLRNFAVWLSVLTGVGLAVIGFTPASALWFHYVSGLSLEMTAFARPPMMILCAMPALMAVISLQRAILVFDRRTRPVIWATGLELTVIVVVLLIGVRAGMIGAVAAAAALMSGRVASTALQTPFHYRSLAAIRAGKRERG